MAEAANLSVSITGDASGLINALATAQNALATLNSSAVDNTACGIVNCSNNE